MKGGAAQPEHATSVLNFLDAPLVCSSAFTPKGVDNCALAVAREALKFTGRPRIVLLSDQECPTKQLVDASRRDQEVDVASVNTLWVVA